MNTGALSSIKVIDLTHNIAGPYCTKLLADMGAEVIKIEPLEGGDPARQLGPFPQDIPHPEKSGFFLYLNTSKLGITLNLKSPTGRDILERLVRDADVLVENFEPGVLSSLGVGYEELQKVNPKLVMTSISNFGQYGPYRDYRATELILFALSGVMFGTGDPDLEPIKFGGSQMQYTAGANAAVATLGAVWGARAQGVGQHVDISIVESFLHMNLPQLLYYQYSGEVFQRVGNATQDVGTGIYPCKDGWVSSFIQARYWENLCDLMGMPELKEDPQFDTPQKRLENKDELVAYYLSWLVDHTKQEALLLAAQNGTTIGPVNTAEDLLKDPHFKDRGFFVEVAHPVAGTFPYAGAPFQISESPWHIGSPAPTLGQHNEEIYCGRLGFTKSDLVLFRQVGVI